MREKMRTFKVEISSKLIKRQEIWLEEYQGYNYDAVKKHAKKIAEGEIEFMCHVISSHMGTFNNNSYCNIELPKPESKFQRFVHMCDYLASRKFLDVKFDKDNNIEE